jgi:glutathione S-transferase
MDSRKIAARIEADHPTPSVHLDSPYIDRLTQNLRAALIPLEPVYLYLVLTRVLSDKSIPYFTATREEDIGMPLDQFHRERGMTAWEESEEAFSKITAMLQENEGPFFMGQTVSYADFVYAGVLLFLKGLGDDVFAKLLKASGDDGQAIKTLLEAVRPWSKRVSY